MDKIKLFSEIEYHLLNDEKPSTYLNKITNKELLKIEPFNFLYELKSINQNLKYHPEGSVFNHTLLVVDEARKRIGLTSKKRELMFSALLHDIGKIKTTKIRNGRITSYNHDFVGAEMTKEFFESLNMKDNFTKDVQNLVKYHMHTFYLNKKLPYGDFKNMIKEVDIELLQILSLCDRLGRGDIDEDKISESYQFIEEFKKNIKKLDK